MREILYLSVAKLDQFRWPRQVFSELASRFSAKLTLPVVELGFDGKNVNSPKSAMRALAKVEAHLNERAKWWEDDSVSVGDWIQFEKPLSYFIVQPINDHEPEVVFFLDCKDDDQQRLLLFGSRSHMRTSGLRGEGRFARGIGGAGGGSEPAAAFQAAEVLLASRSSWLRNQLFARRRRSRIEMIDLMYVQAARESEYDLEDSLNEKIEMRGLARVTGLLASESSFTTMASPLVVEYGR